MSKFKHYAIKTNENFLAKDSRTNCLEIYEDQVSADRIVRRSSQEISVVPCYVYTEKEHAVFDEMYSMLEHHLAAWSNLYPEDVSGVDDMHLTEFEAIHDFIRKTEALLSKARGEA